MDSFEISADEFERLTRRVGRPQPIVRPVGDPKALAAWEASTVPQGRKRVREFLFAEFGDLCPICETPIPRDRESGWADSPEVDHIVPTAAGGLNVWGNVRLAHRHCNQRRNDLRLGELDPAMMRESLATAVYEDAHPEIVLARMDRRIVEWGDERIAAAKEAGDQEALARTEGMRAYLVKQADKFKARRMPAAD